MNTNRRVQVFSVMLNTQYNVLSIDALYFLANDAWHVILLSIETYNIYVDICGHSTWNLHSCTEKVKRNFARMTIILSKLKLYSFKSVFEQYKIEN